MKGVRFFRFLWQVAMGVTGLLATMPVKAQPMALPEIRHWIEANVTCRSSFETEVSSPHFLQSLKGMGFMLSDLIPPGPPEGVWFVPDGIPVLGYQVHAVHYWSDRGSEFYVEVPASLSALQQRFALRPASLPIRQSDGYHAVRLLPAHRARPDAMLLFVRPGRNRHVSEIGCRRYQS